LSVDSTKHYEIIHPAKENKRHVMINFAGVCSLLHRLDIKNVDPKNKKR